MKGTKNVIKDSILLMDIGPWIYIYIDGGQHLNTMDTRLSENGFI